MSFDKAVVEHFRRLEEPTRQARRQLRERKSMQEEFGIVAHIAEQGYLFIVPDGANALDRTSHVYCHGNAVKRAGIVLRKGDRVAFTRAESRKYPGKFEADRIRLLDAA